MHRSHPSCQSFDDVPGQDGAELFDRQRIVASDAGERGDQDARVRAGTEMPTCSAINVAGWPTSFGFGQPLRRHRALRPAATISAGREEVRALRASNCAA